MTDFGFYLVITNPVVGYANCAKAAVRAGVKIIHPLIDSVALESLKQIRSLSGMHFRQI